MLKPEVFWGTRVILRGSTNRKLGSGITEVSGEPSKKTIIRIERRRRGGEVQMNESGKQLTGSCRVGAHK